MWCEGRSVLRDGVRAQDDTGGRSFMPKLDVPTAYAPTPTTDESFFFLNAKQVVHSGATRRGVAWLVALRGPIRGQGLVNTHTHKR